MYDTVCVQAHTYHGMLVESILSFYLYKGSGNQIWIIRLTQSKTPLLDEPSCLPDFYFKIILQKKCNFNIQ